MERFDQYLQAQRQYFYTGVTKSLAWRQDQLSKLETAIRTNEEAIMDALAKDLGKSSYESYTTEIGFVLQSAKQTRKKVGKWMKPKKVPVPMHQFGASAKVVAEPYGNLLIIGPFNYPFQLVIEPLIAALAAGNTAIIKPSEYTPNVSDVLEQVLGSTFQPEVVKVVRGAREETSALIHMPFDHIFFTGSVPVGKIVMEAAAKNLVPITLELGGKSPTIVDRTANLEVAAKRIAWGKFMNAGQTCVAPDYVYVDASVADDFIGHMKQAITSFYTDHVVTSPDYGRIVNDRHYQRLIDLIDPAKVVHGGHVVEEERFIEPTLLYPSTWEDAAMADEIFGPLLPILPYDDLSQVIQTIQAKPKPLALYVFTENKQVEDRVLDTLSFGGGCVNDTISHLIPEELPFGGVGHAGMGAYHGKHGFDQLSHQKSVVKKTTKFDFSVIYPPYKGKLKMVKSMLG